MADEAANDTCWKFTCSSSVSSTPHKNPVNLHGKMTGWAPLKSCTFTHGCNLIPGAIQLRWYLYDTGQYYWWLRDNPHSDHYLHPPRCPETSGIWERFERGNEGIQEDD